MAQNKLQAIEGSKDKAKAPPLPGTNHIIEYHSALANGECVAGQHVHKAYNILVEGLKRGDYIYNTKKANKAIRFIERFCRHSEGRADRLILELWQKALVAATFGIVDEYDLRIFKEIFVVIGRKNGKTLLASAIIAYMAFMDGEYGAKIYCISTKRDLAKDIVDKFYQMVKKEQLLKRRSKKRRDDIYIEESNTVVTALALNPKKSDSFNPHLVVCDELHGWPGDKGLKQFSVMRTALGARLQPLIFCISTAGYENDGIYDKLIERSTSFLNGDSRERRLLPILYTIDDVEKWNDIEEIKKANPNINVSVPTSFYKDEILTAEANSHEQREFKTKYCNAKQNSTAAWLDNTLLENAMVDKTLEDFRKCYGVGGIDLSQTTDLTAASLVIERENKLFAFCRFFMPANRIEALQAADKVPYDIYLKEGVLTLSGENTVDYKDVFNWFVMLHKEYQIGTLKIGYDRYCAQYLVDDLNAYGFHTDWVKQGENLAPVIREFQGTIKDGNFFIANNHLLKAHFLNVALKHDLEKRTFRPVKTEPTKKIDGFVSVIDALTVRHKYMHEIGEILKNKNG